ncbi:MAG: alpha/beta hydrolase [Proteobacteria bacterium]|nr:alpha/beta hydrolase [Pseudomonadota bacterium]
MFDPERRAFLAGSVMLAGAAQLRADTWGDPPTNAVGDPAAPPWPPPERIALWPGRPPGSGAAPPVYAPTMNGPADGRILWIRGIAIPEINVFRPTRPDGSALLVIPGGGYNFVSVQNEGIDVARRFTPTGTAIFVLTYRLPDEGWARRERVPLQDAQRAMRLLRARAQHFAIDADRIGVLGFSAGGHLAADLATAYDEPCYEAVDAADRISARPNHAGLVYPVTSFQQGLGHDYSRDNLLGAGASAAAVAAHSPAEHVRADTPPCCFVHALDDDAVPAAASLAMLDACRRAHVPAEAHFFEAGGHGFGVPQKPDAPAYSWPELFMAWSRRHQRL